MDAEQRDSLYKEAAPYMEDGVPDSLAIRVAGLEPMFSAFDIIEAARTLELDAADVAKVYFSIGSRLELHWLKSRASELPIHDHWHARARSAFRDDLYEQQKRLTLAVLSKGSKAASAEARLESWMKQNQRSVERSQKMLLDLKTQPDPDLAMLSVALRQIRELVA